MYHHLVDFSKIDKKVNFLLILSVIYMIDYKTRAKNVNGVPVKQDQLSGDVRSWNRCCKLRALTSAVRDNAAQTWMRHVALGTRYETEVPCVASNDGAVLRY